MAIGGRTVFGALLSIFFALLTTTVVGDKDEYGVKEYVMSDYCGSTLNMAEKEIHELVLHLSTTDYYQPNLDCTMTIVTSQHHNLLFDFLHIDLYDCSDWFILYGDSAVPSNALSSQLCSKSIATYTTPAKTGIIKFKSDGFGNLGNFKILITSFYKESDGECKHDYHKCGNGRCIEADLACNSRDNCGDNSDETDECEKSKTEWIWWTVIPTVGSIVLVFLVILIVSCVLIHRKKKGMVGMPRPGRSGYPSNSVAMTNQAYSGTMTTSSTGHPVSTAPPPYSTAGSVSTVGPPLAGFSYNQQVYSAPLQQKL